MKCKYWDIDGKCFFVGGGYCYKEDLFKCESKPKPKPVRIKAWAEIVDGKIVDIMPYRICIEYNCINPCTILIDKKYLKGEK